MTQVPFDKLDVTRQLETLLGSAELIALSDDLALAGIPAPVICSPGGVGQVRELVQFAASRGCAIYPLGGRTRIDFGMPGRSEGIALSTLRLDQLIDYPARDMTVTVQAGIRLARLAEVLRAEGQRLPVDIPRAAQATLGGAIATNSSGPRRYGLGTLRDYVIGISVVDAEGRETKAGGRVVKNVAGYDLCKLYTGSMGTLGIITQVTLKLRPVPEASAIAWMTFPDLPQASDALDRLANSETRPTAIDLLNGPAVAHVIGQAGADLERSAWAMAVGFEENADAVRWQQQRLAQEFAGSQATLDWLEQGRAQRLWDVLVEFQAAPLGPVTFKANFRSSKAIALLGQLCSQSIPWAVQLHAGNGIAYGHAPPQPDWAALQDGLARLLECASSLQGNLVLYRCPIEWKRQLPVWGQLRDDSWLMNALKSKLDPRGILNPGRFVAGI
jgi:glycolate oxidase FAD binding subunit